MKPKSPCYHCDERILGCHSECDLYNTFRRVLDDYNRKNKEANWNEAQMYLVEKTIKRKSK